MRSEHVFLIASLVFVCAGMCLLLFQAPHMPSGRNPCTRFILISPLQYKDYWGDEKEEDVHVPWWITTSIVAVIITCQLWPIWGGIVLVAIGLRMLVYVLKQNWPALMDMAWTHFIVHATKKGKSQ